ncbi:MAG: hypothetical protein DI597_14435 [Pseudoxanthomonas spadix]|nr:MAG: hypothetical protein DI597_14435 [Pseudoxanthomonas spadix]
MTDIDLLARKFHVSAKDLAGALVQYLDQTDKPLAAKVVNALDQGGRILLALEFSPTEPRISLLLMDEQQQAKTILHLPGQWHRNN